MNIKRYLLYNSYLFFKKIGYIRLMNNFTNSANILTFHRVNDNDSHPLTTPTEVFEKAMDLISRNYRISSLQALITKIKNVEALNPKTVVITFDDGYKDNLLYAAPILKKYNIPATFFITSGYINTNKVFPWDKQSNRIYPLMTWDEVRELTYIGFDIGSHTINHVNLGKVPIDLAKKEIMGSKEQIENEINMKINTFSYPYGGRHCIRDEAKEVIQEVGFDCCCSLYGGKVTKHTDLFSLYRIPMYPNTIELLMELDNFMTYLNGKMKINIFSAKITLG